MISELGLPRLLHRTLLQDQVSIVVYHAVTRTPLKVHNWCFVDESSFRSQMRYLKKHFEVISLSEGVEQMRNGRIRRPTVVITFDDGFQNNYDVAFPILHEAGLPATIFLTTALVNTDDTVWFCRLNRALAKTSKPSLEWDGRRLDLSGPGAKAETAATIQATLKAFHHYQLLVELRRIILELGDAPDCPIEVGSPFRMLDHEAIAEMAASGLVEFGAHTQTHAILSHLSPEERHEEIVRAVTAVHELTGRPCELFAYPNGRAEDYDVDTIGTLEACGVRAAVTTIEGPNDAMTPVMELRRYGIGAHLSMANFRSKVHHYWALESTRLASQPYGSLILVTLNKLWACGRALRRFSKLLVSQ